MKYLKRVGMVLAALIFVAIVLNNFYVDLIDPHRWDRPVLKEAQQRGFDLVHKRTLSNPCMWSREGSQEAFRHFLLRRSAVLWC
jgi:hypothetical protein